MFWVREGGRWGARASLGNAGASTRPAASWTLPFIVSAIKPPSVARTPFLPPRTYLLAPRQKRGDAARRLAETRNRIMARTHIPVLIVGAGGAGLSLLLLLHQLGIASVLVERRPDVSWYPRARNLNFRTLEGFRGL